MKKLLSILLILVLISSCSIAVAETTPDTVHMMRALTVINYNYKGNGYAYYDASLDVIHYIDVCSLTRGSNLHGYYTVDDLPSLIEATKDIDEHTTSVTIDVLTEVIEGYVSPAYTVPTIVFTRVLIDEEGWVYYMYSNYPELSPFFE